MLLALDATIVVGGPRGERAIPAADFWPAYRRTAPGTDELLLRVRIPIADGRRPLPQGGYAPGAGDLEGRDRRSRGVAIGGLARRPDRLRLGGRDPIRARAAEAALEGAPATPAAIDASVEALRGELHPIDDVRSTGAYRLEVSGRILRRILEDAP